MIAKTHLLLEYLTLSSISLSPSRTLCVCVSAATSSGIQIHVEEHTSLEEMEQAALQAEQRAKEAQSTAAQLRERAQIARRSLTPKEDSD